ncbi:type II secretion system protein [Coprothermobacter platensis]|uniref:type II secretion system protein n=1 Tax=Coprothermobacter platensis TaxID=108819 RepID=UPI00035ED7AD|nr:prepilin-type N-terminal cleavage/methylation domain-containing protein [Coprothermobacter platensis]
MSGSSMKRGFTLMELMVVLAIISLLTLTLYPSYTLSRQRANVSTLLASSPKVMHYLELYQIDHGTYPVGSQALSTESPQASISDDISNYYEKTTPWPWNHQKTLETFFAYESEDGHTFAICWPLDKSANKASSQSSLLTSAQMFSEDEKVPVVTGFDYAVCATSTADPSVVKLH